MPTVGKAFDDERTALAKTYRVSAQRQFYRDRVYTRGHITVPSALLPYLPVGAEFRFVPEPDGLRLVRV